MILFDNSLIKLDYDPATDIMRFAYPDLHDFLLPEIKNSIDILVDNVISFDVKRVLLDSSKTIVAVGGEQSREITAYLVAGLSKTRLQKLARLQSVNTALETTAQGNIRYVKETLFLPFEIKTFASRKEAVLWLMANQLVN